MTMPEEPENKSKARRTNEEIIAANAIKGVLFSLGLGLVCFVLGLFFLPPVGQPSEKGYYTDCSSKLIQLEKKIYWLTKVDNVREKPENWSVCDLIRDDLSQYDGENRKMAELNLSCPKDHQAYLIFPVSAYIGLYEESVQPPVPGRHVPSRRSREARNARSLFRRNGQGFVQKRGRSAHGGTISPARV